MTLKELSRADAFIQIGKKQLSQTRAAKELGLSLRQVQRLYQRFKKEGVKALASQQRGKPSNHRLPPIIKARILELVTCELYSGFGPTLMREKLSEVYKIVVSRETTRQIMIQSGVWSQKKEKRPVIHQQRKRRAHYGELIQIDGSPHKWFESRAEACDLIIYIDDATGHIYGRFFPSETSAAYMTLMREYIKKYGRPVACYSDKHAIFRINRPGFNRQESLTQFGRALKELDIHLICANSPQAKGRVERAFLTLQDRLVKELRLANICSMKEGNEYLEKTFWPAYNSRFAKEPESMDNAHREMLLEHDLDRILCFKEHRTISKNLEIQYKNIIYQIVMEKPLRTMRGAKITILELPNGEIILEYKGKSLPFRTSCMQDYNGEEVTAKEIDQCLREKKAYKPNRHHPWKQKGHARQKMKTYCLAD